jgi:hypothetical protein
MVLAPFAKAADLCRQEGYERLAARVALGMFDDAVGTRPPQPWQSGKIRVFLSHVRLPGLLLHNTNDSHLVSLIRRAIEGGDLVGLRKGEKSEEPRSEAAEKVRLVRRIERIVRGHFAHAGRQYKLVTDVGLAKIPGRDSYQVVDHDDAKRVLDGAATQSGTSAELAGLLGEAREKLTRDWRPPLEPDGLILLRRIREASAPATDTEPTITPSQMKAMVESTEEGEEPTIRLVNVESPTFVPGAETVRISYAIDGPVAKANAVVMVVESVPAKGKRTVVESLSVPGPFAASGEVNWDGKAATPGGFITLKGSPYEVTFELTSKSGKTSKSAPGKLRIEVKDIKITIDDKGPLAVAAPWKTTVSALVDELKKSGMPGDCEGRVIIESPLFKTDDSVGGDMYSDISFTSYQSKAGMGPPLPFVAQIELKAKDGTGKRSAPVLIGTRLLWDLKMETSGELEGSLGARGVQPTAKAFIKKTASFEESATQPKGAAAHLKVGGLRAKSADRALAGTQWIDGGWKLTPPAKRDWAAFTGCGDGSDNRADSAVYFTAGRMAGDKLKVRATIDLDEAFDVADEAAPDGAPAPLRSNQVALTNWRRIPIVGNWIVGAATKPVNIPPLTTEYKRAGVLIEPAPGVTATNIEATYVKEYEAIVDLVVKNSWAFLDKALEREPKGYPVRYRDFIDYWKLENPDAGFFGTLWERIKSFFGSDEDNYKKKCEQYWEWVLESVTKHIPIPDGGITAMKFGTQGPHNQNPTSSFTAGMAPAIAGITTLTKAIFWQFTVGEDTGTFIHEVGHTLFLAHAPGHFDPPKQPGGFVADAHDPAQICLMSYHPSKKYLCGLCLVKLAGWNFKKVKNDGTLLP